MILLNSQGDEERPFKVIHEVCVPVVGAGAGLLSAMPLQRGLERSCQAWQAKFDANRQADYGCGIWAPGSGPSP
ncbi:Glycine--tRNA ligase beta subunit [Clarias magur]|uniref:Glycine--tRNA ligase beta subunit n=1 Tax=Clarias magur TaxID=1594786 RepID=A0A8J4UAS3_CLAMG|nr:Glycine--tRNA ligase beta subunit [Clarias magur]